LVVQGRGNKSRFAGVSYLFRGTPVVRKRCQLAPKWRVQPFRLESRLRQWEDPRPTRPRLFQVRSISFSPPMPVRPASMSTHAADSRRPRAADFLLGTPCQPIRGSNFRQPQRDHPADRTVRRVARAARVCRQPGPGKEKPRRSGAKGSAMTNAAGPPLRSSNLDTRRSVPGSLRFACLGHRRLLLGGVRTELLT
jgi:hypothetical protein